MNYKEKKDLTEDKKTKHRKIEIKYVNFETDDPFEIFFDNYKENIGEALQSKDININDDAKIEFKEKMMLMPEKNVSKPTEVDFMNILKYTNIEKPIKKCNVFGICNQIKILSNKEFDYFKMTMYKFPFEMNIKFDNSEIIKKIFMIFVSSLKDAFKKFKEEKKEFFVKFNSEFLHFSSDLKATKGLKKILISNEISFTENEDYVYISFTEICLVVDIILNTNLTISSTIPFILSTFAFENAMIYTAQIKKMRTIKQESEIYTSYILNGPIWLGFCINFLEHNNKIIW